VSPRKPSRNTRSPPKTSLPFSVTPGPDGELWFTEAHGNKIGRISTGRTITEFPIPTTDSKPVWIVAGPDDALWFTENGGDKIGRIVTDGTISSFRSPNPATNPGISSTDRMEHLGSPNMAAA